MRILIAEDEFVTGLWLKHSLQRLGFEVTGVYASASEAIAGLEVDRPDLAILDIKLRGDADGVAVGITASATIPIIYTTASTDPATARRAALTHPVAVLDKPVDLELLGRMIAGIDGKTASD